MTISLKVSRLPRYYTSREANFHMSSCTSCLHMLHVSTLL